MQPELRTPTLVAVWPGMGRVAQLAGRHLVQALGARHLSEVSTAGFFEVRGVRIERGIARPVPRPHGHLYGWRDPNDRSDLLILLSDEQPEREGWRCCEVLLGVAREYGVRRVLTFAALGTLAGPAAESRVLAVGNGPAVAASLRRKGLPLLEDGEITGLNGLLLAVAARAGLEGLCLLGEFPFYAAAIPNPKASAAVLRSFMRLTGIDMDLHDLDEGGARLERALMEHLSGAEVPAEVRSETPRRAGPRRSKSLDRAALEHLEVLFEEAGEDRSRATVLKAELDRLGVFKQYEDRFLDLFKQAR